MRIAVLGPEGTFCDKAFAEYNKRYIEQYSGTEKESGLDPVYCATIDDVFSMVCAGADTDTDVSGCEFGIVPIENTLDGYVMRTLDLLLDRPVHIIDETQVPVQFSLVANVDRLEEIDTLYVQFKANGQCRQFISSLKDVRIVTTESNMESYYNIGDTHGAAAIIPHHIAEREDRFVIENITDADSNYTRFLVFKKDSIGEEIYADKHPEDIVYSLERKEKVRIPVYIMPAVDRPGILYAILRSFYENQINLISIMSRPTKQEMGTYNFYIEIDGMRNRLDIILDTLNQIRIYNDIKILGLYDE
ncbi:MAG: prephenate dehydratase [Wujia sp.]